MACTSCGFDNREGARFCVECGISLARPCPGCEATIEPGQRFCGSCGLAVADVPAPSDAAPAPNAVRKTVTVLFADLGGSTGFGERTDAEVTRQVLARYHALLQTTIDAHAGTVAKFMGDGMMATFGIPSVAEDDARRAVDAGVALQAGFEAFAAEVLHAHAETLTLRVGINTGEIVIGERDADLIGDALNVAARLEKACRPGHVLVGEETWRLTRSDLAYEALGEVTVAGRAQPVAIFEVAAAAAPVDEVAAPFVGREPEMSRLLDVFADARASAAARLVTILGSPGMGKTRLSREVARRAAETDGAAAFEIRCDRAGEATFAPIAQLIRETAGLGDDADGDTSRAAIEALLPATDTDGDHARVADVLAGLVGAAPARSVEETFWAIRRLVESVASVRPVVIVIDDIQWAEPVLLDLIEHLAEWIADAPVLLVGLARPELREVRPALAEPGRPVAAVVVLDGLDASATEALAAGLLGTAHLPAGLVDRLPTSTDGNPLFVRELIRMLIDDQVLQRQDDGTWELTIDAEAVDVPPTIQSLLGARVERLPAAERHLLELASVVGAEFSLGALRELAGERTPVPTLLESMRRKELVEPTGTYWGDEPVHRFHHVLIRDAAYRRLLKTTRAELHERVAAWTDRTAATLLGEHEVTVAHHYEQAHRYLLELGTIDDHAVALGRRAAGLLTTAAQHALERDDLAAAAGSSVRALALLPTADRDERADLVMMACECLLAAGDGAGARPLVEELGALAGDDVRLGAWAVCFTAQLIWLTDPEGLQEAAEKAGSAASTLADLGDPSGAAKAHQVRAELLARLGRVGDGEAELDLALAAARRADDRRRVTAVLGAAPDAAVFGPSPVARAGGRCLDVIRLLRITTASPSVEASSNRCQGVLEALRGRFDVARSTLADARAVYEDLGLRHGVAKTDLYAGMVELIAGDPSAAVAPLRSAVGDLDGLSVGADTGNATALLARALLATGAIDEADGLASVSEKLAGQNLETAIGWRVARAEVLAARGDLPGAVAVAEEAVEIGARTDLVIDHADACAVLAAVRASAGDAKGAESARADAKRLYEQKGATAPAARLDDQQTPAPVLSESVGEDEGPAMENAATRVFAAIVELARDRRFDEFGSVVADDFERVDRRTTVSAAHVAGPKAWAAAFRSTIESGMDHLTVEPIALRGGRLAVADLRFTSAGGDEIPMLAVIEVDQRDHLRFAAWHDSDQLAGAIDELDARHRALLGPASSPQTVLVDATAPPDRSFALENRATRVALQCVDLLGHGRFDAIEQLLDPDLERTERRQAFPAPPTQRAEDWLDSLRVLHQQFGSYTAEILAIRGERSEAHRFLARSQAGDELAVTTAVLLDDSGRATKLMIFEDDPDGQRAAIDLLDEWYASDEGAEHAGPLRTNRAWFDALNDFDFDAMRRLAAPEFTIIDRRRLGVGAVDLDGYIAWQREYTDLGAFDTRIVGIRLHDRVSLVTAVNRISMGDGDDDEVEWTYHAIAQADPGGVLQQAEIYDLEDWDDALRRFEELAVDPRHPRAENDVTVRRHAWAALLRAGRFDEARDRVDEFTSDRVVRVDRRPTVAAPEATRAGVVDSLEAMYELGLVEVGADPVAVRGERSALYRQTFRTADGFELVILTVQENDADGKATFIANYDGDQLTDAIAELDARFLAGEGADHGRSAACITTWASASADQWEGYLEWCTDDFEVVDHRSTGWPVLDRDGFVEIIRSHAEAVPDLVQVLRKVLIGQGVNLAISDSSGTTPGGSTFQRVSYAVHQPDDAGRLRRLELFDEADWSSALARFDELDQVGRPSPVENDATRRMARFPDLARTRRFEGMVELISDRYVRIDHRQGLPAPTAHGPDDFVALIRATVEVGFDEIRNTPLAVRGEHLALSRVDLRAPDGREIVFLQLHEWEGSKLVYASHYDEGDLETATLELDRRFAASEGAAFADVARIDDLTLVDPRTPAIENRCSRVVHRHGRLLQGGEVEVSLELLAPEMIQLDRRKGVAAPDLVGREARLENLAAVVATFGRFDLQDVAVRGDHLSLHRWTITNDSGFAVSGFDLYELGDDGRIGSMTTWDDDDLSVAIQAMEARHADLCGPDLTAAEPTAPTHPLENAATRALAQLSEAMQAQDRDRLTPLYAEDVHTDDRRTGVSSGVSTGREATLELVRALLDVGFAAMHHQVLAIRGDRLALVSRRIEREDGFVLSLLTVVEVDAQGRFALNVLFDEDDLQSAVEALEHRYLELSAEPMAPSPTLENATTRALARFGELFAARGWDGFAEGYTDEVVLDDRRSGVNSGVTTGRDALAALVRGLADVGFVDMDNETLAVRGDRLALVLRRWRRQDGFELSMLAVHEHDDLDRQLWIGLFDPDDRTAAEGALEDRWAAQSS